MTPFLLVALAAAGPAAAAPLPRIAVRGGRFVERDSGREFRPRGVNYIRLRPTWHGTFSPARYDGARAEAMLADLAGRGLNAVRVFIDHQAGEGVVASADAVELSAKFMANFLDFLARARGHRIYVVPALIHLPPSKRYRDIAGKAPAGIGGVNALYLHQGHVDAKARYAADFAAAIKAHDPSLLTTVLAYELDNETHLGANAPPFSLTSGTLTPADGETYDLASEADLQRMADSCVNRWADACRRAVREVDPEAMVSTNVFTFRAVGRSGPGRLRHDTTKDARFPARPLALAASSLDYLDVHFYPFDARTLDRDLESIEWPALKDACAKAGKPLIMGEFGAFKSAWKTLPEAAAAMRAHLRRVLGLGFVGYIYWTYDTDEQPFLWNAKSGQGEILDALTQVGP